MTALHSRKPARPCHWGHIDGPKRDGVAARVRVWICEQPYRAVRLEGPDPECPGCRWAITATGGRRQIA